MSYRYRCTTGACRARRSLRRKLEDYIRKPKCVCGGALHRDRARELESRRNRCDCGDLPFPHRHGSKWCRHYRGEYTDQDYEDRRYAYQ